MKKSSSRFATGDLVLLENRRRKKGECAKLQASFVGPLVVLEAFSNHTYKTDSHWQGSVQNEDRLKLFTDSSSVGGQAPLTRELPRRPNMQGARSRQKSQPRLPELEFVLPRLPPTVPVPQPAPPVVVTGPEKVPKIGGNPTFILDNTVTRATPTGGENGTEPVGPVEELNRSLVEVTRKMVSTLPIETVPCGDVGPRKSTRLTNAHMKYQDYHCAGVLSYRDALLKPRGQVATPDTYINYRLISSSKISGEVRNKLKGFICTTPEKQRDQTVEMSKCYVGEKGVGLPQRGCGVGRNRKHAKTDIQTIVTARDSWNKLIIYSHLSNHSMKRSQLVHTSRSRVLSPAPRSGKPRDRRYSQVTTTKRPELLYDTRTCSSPWERDRHSEETDRPRLPTTEVEVFKCHCGYSSTDRQSVHLHQPFGCQAYLDQCQMELDATRQGCREIDRGNNKKWRPTFAQDGIRKSAASTSSGGAVYGPPAMQSRGGGRRGRTVTVYRHDSGVDSREPKCHQKS